MKAQTKSLIKSVVALSVISVVCVALLAVANAFIPKYKPTLDIKTATLINGIVEAQGQGYAGAIIMLTAVGEDGTIFGVELKSESENSPGTNGIFTEPYFKAFQEYVKGKTVLVDKDINAETKATSMYSIGGVVKAVNLSVKAAEAVKGGSL